MKRFTVLALLLALLVTISAFATTSVTTARIVYSGSGSTGPFSVPFYFLADSELTVTKISASTLATVSVLVLDVDYTVTGEGTTSGYVTLTATLSSSYKLVIQRATDFLQATDLVELEAFSAETLEGQHDKETRELQELKDEVNRSVRLLPGTTDTSINPHLANPAASTVIGWDSTGKALTNYTTTTLSVPSIDMLANYADLAAAVAAIGSTPKTLMVTAASAPDENSTIPCTLKLFFTNGGALNPALGVLVTICSPDNIMAQPDQTIFGGNGTIAFTKPGTIYSDWWGPPKDGTDAYADLKASIESAPATSTVVLGTGIHTVQTGLNVTKGISLKGNCASKVENGTYPSTLKAGAAVTGTLLTWLPAQPYPGQNTIECITLDGNYTADNGLEIKQSLGLLVKNVVSFNFNARGQYVNGWGNGYPDEGSFGVTTFEGCWSGANEDGFGFAVERNGTGFWGPTIFKGCHAYYNKVGLFVRGDNSTSTAIAATSVSWSDGMIEGCDELDAKCDQDGNDYVIRGKDGANIQIGGTNYFEQYGANGKHYWLSGNSYASVQGGNVDAVYWDSWFEDNSTLCVESSGASNAYFSTLYGGQSGAGFLTNRMCVGGKIADKSNYGSPYFPLTTTSSSAPMPGNAYAWKGFRFTDHYGTEYVQVEDEGYDGIVGHAIAGNAGDATHKGTRWAVSNGRVIVPFTYEDLNTYSPLPVFWSEANSLLRGATIVITESFVNNDNASECDSEGVDNPGPFISLGSAGNSTTTRRKLISWQSYAGLGTNLGQNETISAYDNNETDAVLAYSSATSHPSYYMPGYSVKHMTGDWQQSHDRSHIYLWACPHATTTSKWSAGAGYVILDVTALEFN